MQFVVFLSLSKFIQGLFFPVVRLQTPNAQVSHNLIRKGENTDSSNGRAYRLHQ